MGFCMGGALTIASAVRVQGISAASCFYGIPGRDFAKAEDVKCPIMCHFGKKDTSKGFAAPEDAKALEEALKKQSHPFQVIMYDADHAFMNEVSPRYDAAAAKLATENTMAFFSKHLA